MIEWFAVQPWVTGVVTFLLMWTDWLLTIGQERERQLHYSEHYESYPINTIEGSPLFQKAILARRIIDRRHIVPAAILSVIVAVSLLWIPEDFRVPLFGYVWGLYFIVIMTHLDKTNIPTDPSSVRSSSSPGEIPSTVRQITEGVNEDFSLAFLARGLAHGGFRSIKAVNSADSELSRQDRGVWA